MIELTGSQRVEAERIATEIITMFGATRLTPCRAVVRTKTSACASGVVYAHTSRHLHEHFGVTSMVTSGVEAGFCGRAITPSHSRHYLIGYWIGQRVAVEMFEGAA